MWKMVRACCEVVLQEFRSQLRRLQWLSKGCVEELSFHSHNLTSSTRSDHMFAVSNRHCKVSRTCAGNLFTDISHS